MHPDRVEEVSKALNETGGVKRLELAQAQVPPDEMILSADITPHGADEVMALIHELEVHHDDYVMARLEVIAPAPAVTGRAPRSEEFSWVEVMGEARANARPLARYLAMMTIAGVIAALGVIESNPILIVGAMAVSPDLLPVCATCVGIVGRRWTLVRRAFGTLFVGLYLVASSAAVLTAMLGLTGLLEDDFEVGQGGIQPLVSFDYSTILVALAAGIASMLSFETRASAAVGVAISVTTIPASAYIGVAIGNLQLDAADGAAVVLGVNVAMLLIAGTLTLMVQRFLAARPPRL